LFTPPTPTRQDCVVRVGGVNTTTDKTRQFCFVSTQFRWVLSRLDPVSNFQVFSNPQYIWDWTAANCKLGRYDTIRYDYIVNVR